MAENKKEFTKLNAMREAAKKGKGRQPLPPAKAAVPKSQPKKENPRSAKARDARAKARGRLPVGADVRAEWNGTDWEGYMEVTDASGGVVMSFNKSADGVFRLMEELDVMFWNWYADKATDPDLKARLVFAPHPPAPAPWSNPETPVGKAE